MRGVIAAAGYVPYHRLDRSEIAILFGSGGGPGSRSVAAYDEDTTTMAVAAADLALRSTSGLPDALWFATSAPAYLDKSNASAIHAALGLASQVGVLDIGGAVRSGIGALRTALETSGSGTTLVVASDIRDGQPTGTDEAFVGDGAAALLIGDSDDNNPSAAPILVEYLGGASHTVEITERWRLPGSAVSRTWEERFVETVYAPAAATAIKNALKQAGLAADDIDHLIVTGLSQRATARTLRQLRNRGFDQARLVDNLGASIGNTGTAHPGLMLCHALEQAQPGECLAVVALADGVEVIILRTTDALGNHRPVSTVAEQITSGGSVSYGRFLSWRQMVALEPPNRPPPNRPSSAAAYRSSAWKFGFVGSRDRASQMVHLPPARVSQKGGAVDDMEPLRLAHQTGTVASFTVDRLVYSPSPPVMLAVVDFDDGGRVPLELTDYDPDEVHVGMRVRPTFRRFFTADDIHNYFWKVSPIRNELSVSDEASPAESAESATSTSTSVADRS